jgi:hypothetical protein
VPAVADALPKIQAASTRAQPVFALDYRQTPASVKDTSDDIGSSLMKILAAELSAPLASSSSAARSSLSASARRAS